MNDEQFKEFIKVLYGIREELARIDESIKDAPRPIQLNVKKGGENDTPRRCVKW